jgi:tripeptide aminopeptidase
MGKSMVDIFMELVRIDSESGQEEEVLKYLESFLTDELDAKCERDSYNNLIAKIPGKNSDKKEPILLSCHADTVKPGKGIEPVLESGIIRSKGETILGADDKAGITEVLEALRTAEKRPPVEFVISREEEIGLVGAKHLDTTKLSAKMGFLFDGDVLDKIVIGGPAHMMIDVEITGQAAHAGMEPEKGISAIKAASNGISKMNLGRIDDESTANVGIIKGGEIRNGIPEKVYITAECRSLDDDKCLKIADEMKAFFEEGAKEEGATADVKLSLAYKAVNIPENSNVVEISKKAITGTGMDPFTEIICGGTDASIYNEKGIQTAVLGIGVEKEHSKEEQVAVSDMEKAVAVLKNVFDMTS